MKKHLNYLSYVLRHKWFVFVAGRKVGVGLWQLLIHDWHKFLPSEWTPYVNTFYGGPYPKSRANLTPVLGDPHWPPKTQEDVKREFDLAWLKHQHRAPHHWQYWVLNEDDGGTKVLEMPDKYRREMLADWMGAGRAITGRWEVREWYEKNKHKMQLHPATRAAVEEQLGRG